MPNENTFEVRDRRDGDWFWCQKSVLKAKIPHTVKLTYLALCSYANKKTETCYPSISRLAADSGLSNSSVIRALDCLVGGKAIQIKEAKGKVNQYTLLNVTSVTMTLVSQEAENQCHRRHKTSGPRVTEQEEGTKRKNNYGSVKGLEILRKKKEELLHRLSL